jgi:transmembrane sensor
VVSGVVEIKRPAAFFSSSAKATRLAAGDQAVLSSLAKSPSLEVSHIQPETATTWQRGYFSFAGEPLSSVIDSINRYAKRRIEIGDASIGEMTYAGTVFQDRTDEWAENLTQIFPVRALERNDGVIVLLLKEK